MCMYVRIYTNTHFKIHTVNVAEYYKYRKKIS